MKIRNIIAIVIFAMLFANPSLVKADYDARLELGNSNYLSIADAQYGEVYANDFGRVYLPSLNIWGTIEYDV